VCARVCGGGRYGCCGWVMGCPAACTCTTWIETCGRGGQIGMSRQVGTVIPVPELESSKRQRHNRDESAEGAS
jgi:hypothetical protein